MRLHKTASGKTTIKMSKKEWTDLGKKAGWMKEADYNMIQELNVPIDDSLDGLLAIKGALSQGFSGDRDSIMHLAEELNDIEMKIRALKDAVRNSGR